MLLYQSTSLCGEGPSLLPSLILLWLFFIHLFTLSQFIHPQMHARSYLWARSCSEKPCVQCSGKSWLWILNCCIWFLSLSISISLSLFSFLSLSLSLSLSLTLSLSLSPLSLSLSLSLSSLSPVTSEGSCTLPPRPHTQADIWSLQ